MSLLSTKPRMRAESRVTGLLENYQRRIAAMPPGICPLCIVESFITMAAAQSCGKCTSCRDGLPELAEMLHQIRRYDADDELIAKLDHLAKHVRDTADCAIGWGTAEQLLEMRDVFADEFEAHIEDGRCAHGIGQGIPCITECPAHVDIPAYISLVQAGDCAGAIKMIRKDNPFPTACAMICEHPCEHRCRRMIIDAPLNIRGIKKYAVDAIAADKVDVPERLPETGKRIAVIGGGPSGLTCAYYAALMGHSVTVFEGRSQLGGMMRYGIPAYRFPRHRLDEDINAVLSAGGIQVELNQQVDAARMKELAAGYDAVYVAIGAQGGKGLSAEGVDAEGVISAVDMLGKIGDDEYPDFTGKRVVVVGGGNVAMDCARTSKRAGAKTVTVVYRRRIEDMTAQDEEIQAALAEGVDMMTLYAPLRIDVDEQGTARALVCQPQQIGPVKDGRPSPVAADKPEYAIEADVILIAVGQDVVSAPFEEFGMKAERGKFVADEYLHAEGFDNVFVGGDCQTGPKTVILAIAQGKAAARNIDEFFGFDHKLDCGAEVLPARANNRTAYGRIQVAERPAAERKYDFDQVELEMSDAEITQECSRCLRCDHYGIAALDGRGLEQW